MLSEQGGRGFLPDTRDAGRPSTDRRATARVRRRPDRPCRLAPVLVGHFLGAEQRGFGQPAAQVEHSNRHGIVGHHLQQVPVSADHDDRVFAFLRCQRAQHVVGLETLGAGRRNPERIQQLHDHVDLGRQVVGDFFDIGVPCGSGSATRCALYDGIRSTRNCGRQSRSRQTARRWGRCWVMTTANRVDESADGIDRPAVGSGD